MPPFAGEPPHWQHHTALVSPGVKIHYVDVSPLPSAANGIGHTLLLIHGYPETGYSWRHVIEPLRALGFRLVLPDYRGAGESGKTLGGYDKTTMSRDLRNLVKEEIGIAGKIIVVGHDIGMMVAVSLALQFPDDVEGLVVFEAPVPGTQAFNKVTTDPDSAFFNVFHFFFHNAPDNLAELLTTGKEREYITHFYDRLCYDPSFLTPADLDIYTAAFSKAGAMRAGFETYRTFLQDKEDFRSRLAREGKLKMPLLALAGEASAFAPMMEEQCREFAEDVTFETIEHSSHWVQEEQPEAFIATLTRWFGVQGFLN